MNLVFTIEIIDRQGRDYKIKMTGYPHEICNDITEVKAVIEEHIDTYFGE